MILRWLSYILVVIFSVQTVAAIADAHKSHQSGTQHLEFDHPHEQQSSAQLQAPQLKDTNSEQPFKNNFDCHHCCHCHSCHTHLLIRESLPTTQSLSYNSNPRGSVNSAQIGVLSQPYRPPRV